MNEQKTPHLNLLNLSLQIESHADQLDCCNVFYEHFIKLAGDTLTDRYRAALYCMVELGVQIAEELREISNQVYAHSPKLDTETDSNTATLRYLDPDNAEKENE